MGVTPLDIQNASFKSAFRGYQTTEVDSFLNRILLDYEKLYKENQMLKEEVKRIKEDLEKYRAIEENLSATLVIAQQTAKDMKTNAQKEADLLVDEARLKVKTMMMDAQEEIGKKEKELMDLNNECNHFKHKMLSFVETQYRVLIGEIDQALPTEEPTDLGKELDNDCEIVD